MSESVSVVNCGEANDLKEESFQLVDGQPRPASDGSIYMVGGFDGCSWLSGLDIYFNSQDLMRPLTPMRFVHTYASAAKFCGELYILGGVEDNLWSDTGMIVLFRLFGFTTTFYLNKIIILKYLFVHS